VAAFGGTAVLVGVVLAGFLSVVGGV